MGKGYSYGYDDSKLRELYKSFSEKERVKALRGAFRKQAGFFRKAAIANLRSSLSSNSDLEKGIRSIVFKRTLGFRVTVGTKVTKNKSTGKKTYTGFHKNRRGEEKPVLIWAEEGTATRRTKSGREKHSTRRGWRTRNVYMGANRGRMRRYAFMTKTKSQVTNTITGNLHDEIRNYVYKIAKKNGCIV